MDDAYVVLVLEVLSAAGVKIEPGLRDEELARVEASLSFQFPPDLRTLLSAGLPVSKPFPHWRSESHEELRWLLDGPADGIAFDVEMNAYWRDDWGPRPADVGDAIADARKQIAKAPTLVPVYGHRFIAAEPSEEDNPVFSVSQTDVIVYGNDLAHFLAVEFRVPRPGWSRSAPKPIRFWGELAEA
jgi:hypothetical protein